MCKTKEIGDFRVMYVYRRSPLKSLTLHLIVFINRFCRRLSYSSFMMLSGLICMLALAVPIENGK